MANNPKSLEELAREVLDTQQGISPEQFDALINPGAPTNPAPTAVVQPVVEPTPAPSAVAPTASAPAPSAAPLTGEPDILGRIPEKFRDKDVQSSVDKMSKSYQELEAELKKQQDELANMQKIVQSISMAPAPQPQAPTQKSTPRELKDADFFEKPLETVKELTDRAIAERLMQYHAEQERTKFVNEFRSTRPDFDYLRPEIMEILAARPDLDRDPRNLPVVYEMAKQFKAKKIADLRNSLGLVPPTVQPTQSVVQPPIDRERLKAELVAEIQEEIKRRRAAQGIQGAVAPVAPQNRATPTTQPAPVTPEDQIFNDMMTSGPKKLSIELDK